MFCWIPFERVCKRSISLSSRESTAIRLVHIRAASEVARRCRDRLARCRRRSRRTLSPQHDAAGAGPSTASSRIGDTDPRTVSTDSLRDARLCTRSIATPASPGDRVGTVLRGSLSSPAAAAAGVRSLQLCLIQRRDRLPAV